MNCTGRPSLQTGVLSPTISGRMYSRHSRVTLLPASLRKSLGTARTAFAIFVTSVGSYVIRYSPSARRIEIIEPVVPDTAASIAVFPHMRDSSRSVFDVRWAAHLWGRLSSIERTLHPKCSLTAISSAFAVPARYL